MALKTASSMPSWGILVKLLVSGGLMAWLVSKADIAQVWETAQELPEQILALTLVVIWATLFAIAKRWQLVIRLGGMKAPLPRLIEATFIGAFFNQFLPSSVGGDFFRILAARSGGATLNNAITGVFIDRLCGFIAFGILCLAALPMEGAALLGSDLKWPFLATLFLLPGVLGGIAFLPFIPTHWHASFIIRPFHSAIQMVQGAFGQKGLLLPLLASSLVGGLLTIFGFQVLMAGFDIPLTWGQGAAILPVVMLITSLPISFAGWGLREGAIVVALGIYGVPQETALALSLTYGALQLVSALPGLVLWVLEKRRPKPALPEA